MNQICKDAMIQNHLDIGAVNQYNHKRFSEPECMRRIIMDDFPKKIMVTLPTECLPALDKLKKDQFYNESKAEMMRYIIGQGLEAINKGDSHPPS